MAKLRILVVVLSLLAVSCSDAPTEVVVGDGTAEASEEVSEASIGDAVDAAPDEDDAVGEPWIDPQDALISEAGGIWADDDFEVINDSVGNFSSPVEITPLSDVELADCSMMFTVFDTIGSSYEAEAMANSADGSEVHQAVLDRGSDAPRIAASFSDYVERCPEVESYDLVYSLSLIDVDGAATMLALEFVDGDQPEQVWVSIAQRENLLSLLAILRTDPSEVDEKEFARLVDLQVDALNAAPVSRIEGRAPYESDYVADVQPDATDAAGDAAEELAERVEDAG